MRRRGGHMSIAAPTKQAIVLHSGGMDSSICLAVARQNHPPEAILSLTIDYGQRHQAELAAAKKICQDWQIEHDVLEVDCLRKITQSALIDRSLNITPQQGDKPPSTLVTGRNGLMARLAAIYADCLQANTLYMGVIEVESANSGYRDCNRDYIDKLQTILQIDLNNPNFQIITPVVHMTKQATLELANQLGVLNYLLEHTVTCYNGLPKLGCQQCPACDLRNQGLREFALAQPHHALPFAVES